jgi:hypothetical protein
MIERIKSGDIIHKLSIHKRFMVFCHLRDCGAMAIRPTWDLHPLFPDVSLTIYEDMFPNLVMFEGYVDELYDEILEFGISPSQLYYDGKLKALMISFENGWIKSTSLNKCFCYDTLAEMIYNLHPEFFDNPIT